VFNSHGKEQKKGCSGLVCDHQNIPPRLKGTDLREKGAYENRKINICHKHTRVKDFSPQHSTEASSMTSEEILEILRGLLHSDGITIAKLRFITHALDNDLPPEAYSNSEIARIIDKSERTARSVRTWACDQKSLPSTHGKIVAACSVFLPTSKNLTRNSRQIHEAMDFLPPEWTLVLEKLQAMRFNSFEGDITVPRRAKRTAAWVDRWGVMNVLHAIWLAERPQGSTRNLPGFVRSIVESGQQSPPGWAHPDLLHREHTKTRSPSPTSPARPSDVDSYTAARPSDVDSYTAARPSDVDSYTAARPPDVDSSVTMVPVENIPVASNTQMAIHHSLSSNMRPNLYHTWFADLRFWSDEGVVFCWCPSPNHRWVLEKRSHEPDKVLPLTGLQDRRHCLDSRR
jgi:hypothetical protein